MKHEYRSLMVAASFLVVAGIQAGCSRGGTGGDLRLESVMMPPGFRISLYARVPHARSMTLGTRGTLFVGTRGSDRVYAVVDNDGDGSSDSVLVIASGLGTPNGVAFRDGSLYVGEIGRIIRFDRIEERLNDPPPPVVVRRDFPTEEWHGWKFIAFGPDNMLYVPVGAPCNVCEESDERFATILRMRPDGSGLEVFARGVRNTVGFDWHPATGSLWFTDNGRDYLGDDLPPDELNHAPRAGMHFGFPYFHGGDTPDPEYSGGKNAADFIPPARKLGAHVAALGMRFYTGTMFPPEYRGNIFVAEHGSWNRSSPVGYRITRIRLEGDRVVDYSVFASGWLQGARHGAARLTSW